MLLHFQICSCKLNKWLKFLWSLAYKSLDGIWLWWTKFHYFFYQLISQCCRLWNKVLFWNLECPMLKIETRHRIDSAHIFFRLESSSEVPSTKRFLDTHCTVGKVNYFWDMSIHMVPMVLVWCKYLDTWKKIKSKSYLNLSKLYWIFSEIFLNLIWIFLEPYLKFSWTLFEPFLNLVYSLVEPYLNNSWTLKEPSLNLK